MRKRQWVAIGLLFAALSGCGSTSQTADDSNGGSGALMVRSDPSGAAIAVNGRPTGRVTPADVSSFASEGENVVTLTLSGSSTWSGLATVSEGSTFTLEADLTPASAGAGTLDVRSDPAGATVLLDGSDTGYTTPATIPNVAASQHVVEYQLSGFYPFREQVAVAPGRTAASAPTLTRLGQGRITGRVLDDQGNGVVGAQIGVRDLDVSTTTSAFGVYVLPNVPQGTYTLDAAIASGGTSLRGSREGVRVQAGATVSGADILTAQGGAAGTISGRVLDTLDRPIDGAEVFASMAASPSFLPDSTVTPYRATTDAAGRYSFGSLPPGFWVLTAASAGYATVTHGINPQVPLAENARVTVNFALPDSTAPKPFPPQQLSAMAFTFPAMMSRGRGGYEAIRDRLLRRVWGSRYDQLQRAAAGARTAPAGSIIEVDLSWIAPGSPDLVGYYIGRSLRQDTGYELIEDLLNPHAGLWIDYSARLSPETDYYYRVTAVNARGVNSDPGNTGYARPLGQITVRGPVDNAASATPTFQWDTLTGAFAYDVQLFDSYPDRFLSPRWEVDTLPASQTSVTYDGPALQHGHTYYWIVAGRDGTTASTIHGWSISRITPFTVP